MESVDVTFSDQLRTLRILAEQVILKKWLFIADGRLPVDISGSGSLGNRVMHLHVSQGYPFTLIIPASVAHIKVEKHFRPTHVTTWMSPAFCGRDTTGYLHHTESNDSVWTYWWLLWHETRVWLSHSSGFPCNDNKNTFASTRAALNKTTCEVKHRTPKKKKINEWNGKMVKEKKRRNEHRWWTRCDLQFTTSWFIDHKDSKMSKWVFSGEHI